jgi:hypothetical protein
VHANANAKSRLCLYAFSASHTTQEHGKGETGYDTYTQKLCAAYFDAQSVPHISAPPLIIITMIE